MPNNLDILLIGGGGGGYDVSNVKMKLLGKAGDGGESSFTFDEEEHVASGGKGGANNSGIRDLFRNIRCLLQYVCETWVTPAATKLKSGKI